MADHVRKIANISVDAVVNSANQLYPELGSIKDDAGMGKWFESAYKAIEEMDAFNKANADRYQREYGGTAGQRIQQLLDNAGSVSEYLKSKNGSGNYSQWSDALEQYRKVLSGLADDNSKRSQYFRQWNNDTEYRTAMQQNEWLTKYDGQSAEQLRSAAEALADGDEKSWLTGYADHVGYSERMNYDVSAGQQELQELQKQRSNMKALQQKIQEYQSNPLLQMVNYTQYKQDLADWNAFQQQGGMSGLDQQMAALGQRNFTAKQTQNADRLLKEHEQWLTTVRAPEAVSKELEAVKAQEQALRERLSIDKDNVRTPMGGISSAAIAALRQDEAAHQQALAQIQELEKEYWWAQKQQYDRLLENRDFAAKSQYVSTRLPGASINLDAGLAGFRDAEYDYINRNPVALANQSMLDQQSGRLLAGTDRSQLQEMSDDEIKIYNYIYATQGKDAARKYVNFLTSDLNARQTQAYEKFAKEAAASGVAGQALATTTSLMMAPMRGAAYVGQAADLLADGKIDPNAGYNRYANISSAMRNAVAEQIQNNPKWGAAGAFGYQLAMSMGDFLLAAGLSAGSSVAASAIMGTGAAADAVIDAKKRGLSDNQAFTLGTIAGLAETLTEKYSLETLLDADALADSVGRYVLKNMAAEGSEEAASSLINLMADVIVSKDKSQWKQSMQQYQDMGYSKGEAFGKTLADQAAAIGLDALGGAISGGILGGGNALRNSFESKGVGDVVNALGMNDAETDRFIKAGLTAAPQSTQHQVAKEMSQKLQQGKQLTAADKGRLARANMAMTNEMVRKNAGSVSLATAQVDVGSDDARWQQAQRLSLLTGRDIVFYNGSPNEEGYFQNGKIHINANVVKGETFAPVFAHELTYSAEMADVYEDLQRLAFQKLRNLGEDISQMRKDKMELYAAEGHPLSSEKEADQEIVARFVQDYLLTDELTIQEVVLDSPSLGRKILNWIDGLLAKMGNENAQERVFLSNARKIYSEALKQTRNNQRPAAQQAGNKAAPESGTTQKTESAEDAEFKKGLEEVSQAYERGELDDATYNDIVDNANQEYQRRKAEAGRKYNLVAQRSESSSSNGFSHNDGPLKDSQKRNNSSVSNNNSSKMSIDDTQQRYSAVSLAEDGKVYTYDFLTSLPDMRPVTVAEVNDIRDGFGKIDSAKVVELGKKNALSVGTERDGEIFVKNRYTGRELQITTASIRHGLNGAMNRLLTNARLGSVIGELVQNAVPINALHNTADIAKGTYAMAGYAVDSDGREFVAIVTVEQRTGNVEGVDVFDVTHAVSGRQKKRGAPVDTKSQGINLSTHASEISIANFLPIVKDVYQSVLSLDVLKHLGSQRPTDGYYSDRVKFSLSDNVSQPDNMQQSSEVRNNLNRKATEYLTRTESRFVRRLGDQLGIPRYAQWDIVRPVIDSMVDEFLQTGKISDETLANAFNTAYDQGKVSDREFYDQYKDVKDHLRTTPVTLSQRDQADIPDFNLWRKSMFGSLRIVNEGGLPVDTAYQELHSMAPELFSESITHPADQLQRMGEVAQQIRKVEKSLDEYYGPEAGEFRRWAQHDFGTAIGDMMPELRTVKRYAEQEQKEAAALPKLKTTKDAQEAFRKRKQAQKAKDAANARNLLSEQDKRIVKQLLDGIVTLEELEGKDFNLKGIREVYEATQEYEMIDRQIRQYQAELRAKRQDDADSHLSSSLYWRDKKSGFALSRETMRRNILDIVTNRSEAMRLLKNYFEPVQIAEAERQRFLNKYRNKIRELNLSTSPAKGDEVSEAYAVQLYGEAITSIEMIQQSKGHLKERDGRDIDDWKGLIYDMFQHSPSLDRAKIENAVKTFRQIYDEFFQKMNEVLVRNGYPPVEYRKGYFPHFQGQDDGVAAHFGKLLGTNFMDDVLPTTLNGLTHTFKPGKQWFANAQERTGFQTKYDAVEGFDKYIEGVSNVIFHTDNIQKLRALSRQIRYRSSDEGIKEEASRIQEDERLTEQEKSDKLDKLYEGGRFALSNFVTELDEYTNILAGKKSMSDRGMERMLGRKYYTWMKHLESQVGANMVGGNIGSALTNFIPLTQAWGQLDTNHLLAGMMDTLKGMNKSDGFIGRSDFLTSRHGSDKLVQTWIQKASAKAGILMEMVDGFTSEAITRGAYYQNLQRGMSEEEALHQADIFAAGVIADRSKGAMPTVFEMKNPIAKIFTQFQLEVNNQMSEIFKDLPRAMREKKSREIAAMLLKYFLGAWLFNNLYEWLVGRRSALDPVDMLLDFGGDWKEDGLAAAGRNLASATVENIPFVGGLMGGGRVPISSAIPDVDAIWGALTEEDYHKDEVTGEETGIALNKRLSTLGTELAKPAMLLAFPFGGNQIMKAWKGVKTVLEGGSYVLNNAGDRQLQYAVDTSDPFQFLGKALMASVMGKSSLPEAREWSESGGGKFSVKQTAVYDDLVAADVDGKEAYSIIDAIRKAAKTEDLSLAQVQRNLLEESDLSDLGKAIVYYGLLAGESERKLMDSLTDIGATAEAAGSIAMDLYRIRGLSDEDSKSAQAEALKNAALTEEEKRTVVASLMKTTELLTDSGEPTEYAKFLAAAEGGLSVDDYMAMRAMGVSTDDYLEFADTGISADAAMQIVQDLKTLKPSAGAAKVSWLQKCQVVLDADLTEAQKLETLGAVGDLTDATYEKIQLGYNMGMDLQSYFDLKAALPRYDANGNGSYTAKETQAAIDAAFPHLSSQQKAVLWQLQNKSWKPKSNPYDKQVGQLVYDAMSANAEQSQAVASDDPYALMRALSMIP